MSSKEKQPTLYYKGFNSEPLIANNNDDILPNFDSSIVAKEFFQKIKNQISTIVNNEYDNIVVLAGAGASITSSNVSKGKTVVQLYEIIDKILSDTNDNNYSFNDLYTLGLITQNDMKNNNLENILSKLLKANSIFSKLNNNNSSFLNAKNISDKLENTINTIKKNIYLNTSCYNFDESICYHDKLIKKLSYKLPDKSRLNIVTTNYDKLFEEAANSINYWVFDGFSFSNPPIFDPDIFDWQLIKSIDNKKTEEVEYKKNTINLLKIHGSIDWKLDKNSKLTKVTNNFDNTNNTDYQNSIMIFPSSEKYMESYQEPYFSLMVKFQEMLRKPNTLLISIGFSFADNHIFEMILQAIKHNNSLITLITDLSLDLDKKNSNWKELDKLSDTYNIHFLKATLNDNLINYL